MNADYVQLKQRIDHELPDVTSRSPVLAAAVGFAMARVATIPSSPVDDCTNYYNLSVASGLLAQLNALNEAVIVNCNDAAQWSRAFWQIRYQTAHLSIYWEPIPQCGGFFNSFTQADALLSVQQMELLNNNREKIFKLANDIVWTLNREV